jgi:hypothetical protein
VNSFIGDNLFVSLNNSYGFADKYYVRDSPIGPGFIKDYKSNFLSLRVGYKPISKLMVETEVGYFVKKTMNDDINLEQSSKGFSDLSFYARYTFFKDPDLGLDFSGGVGVKIPLTTGSVYVPQNIQSSTGGYASILNLVGKKIFPEINSALILSHRTDINFTNKYDYKYGNSYRTSLMFVNNVFENLVIGLEFRNEIRQKDFNVAKNEILDESGYSSIILSPIVRYSIGDFVLNTFFDMPAYQYYYGDNGQLSYKNSFGFSLAYSTRLDF